MSDVEPVLLVEVVAMGLHPDSTTLANVKPLCYGIEVGGVRLPVAYRSRSEALRIAERAYSLLVDGHEERWELMVERRAPLVAPVEDFRREFGRPRPGAFMDFEAALQQPVESDAERIMREHESPGVPVMPGRAEVQRADAALEREQAVLEAKRQRMPPALAADLAREFGTRAGQRCLCGHLRSQHSPAREDDYWCLVTGCACSGWHPRR